MLLKKAEDPYLALLVYRSTPLLISGYSPTKLLMNRKLRTALPILPQDLKPNVPDYSMLQSSEKQQREKQTQIGPQSYQIETSYVVLIHNRQHLTSSPNKQFTSDKDFEILPDIPNNETNPSEVHLRPTQDGTVYTRSERASRLPKHYSPDTN